MIRMAVLGYGYWGPNIVRNFSSTEGVQVEVVCDSSPDALQRLKKSHPAINTTTDCNEVLKSPYIDAIAVVTPVSTHYELAKKALQEGKHIFIEKPFTATCSQAEELVELAEKKNLKIMVDHTFLFTGAVKKIKELVDDGTVGNIYYYDSMRINLGLFQHDVNVVWDLAPHDFSIMDYLIAQEPRAVVATGENHFCPFEYVAYITVYFPNNVIAHFNVNWLSPVKVRTTLLSGEKKMIVWNDLAPDEKIKVYDKGIEVKSSEGVYSMLINYRSGDMWSPKVEHVEALKLEADYFVECITNGRKPINDGEAGLRIVRLLEAASRSLKKRGEMVYL
jgi:predicted dehydrogenase